MAIDASIALGLKPVQVENPLNNMAKFANIQNDMANMALHRQKMATDAASTARQNELNNYLGSGGRDPDRIYQLGGPEALNPINQAESARITGLKASGETLDATMNRNKSILQDYVDTPKAARQWLYMQFIDPAMKATFDKLGVSFDQAASRIPDDPAEFGKWKEQSIMGMEKHLQARGVKNITPSGDRNVLTDLQGKILGEIPIGATMEQRINTAPAILAGIANQDVLNKQIAQGNPGGQAPVASQTNQLLNASVAQANDQTPPPISPLAANVNRQQAELAGVNAQLRADQEQALAAKQPLDAKDRRIKDYAQAIRDGRSPNDQDMKDLRLQIEHDSSFAPPTRIDVNSFDTASNAAQKDFIAESAKTRTSLRNSKGAIDNINKAITLIPSSAQFMGPGGDPLLNAASFLNNRLGLNINTKGVTDATELRSRIFSNVIDTLKKLDSQPSERQQATLEKALGTIGEDPKALVNVLRAFQDVIRTKVEDYNKDVTDAELRGVKFPFKPQIDIGEYGGRTPPTSAAVAGLKANPGMRADFEDKFGPGSADKVLGKGK